MTPTTSTAVPPRTADSPLSGSPAGAPSPAESSSQAGRPSARSPESASSWSTATSSRTRSLYSPETTRRAVADTGPERSMPQRRRGGHDGAGPPPCESDESEILGLT